MSFKPSSCLLVFKRAMPGDHRGQFPLVVCNAAGFVCVANLLVLENGVIHAYHETAETHDYVASGIEWMASLEAMFPPAGKDMARFAQEFCNTSSVPPVTGQGGDA